VASRKYCSSGQTWGFEPPGQDIGGCADLELADNVAGAIARERGVALAHLSAAAHCTHRSRRLAFSYYPLLFVFYKRLSAGGFFAVWALLSVAGSAEESLYHRNGGGLYWLNDWLNEVGWAAVLPTIITDLVLLILYAMIATYALTALIPRLRLSANR
jgi:hypothetical protein